MDLYFYSGRVEIVTVQTTGEYNIQAHGGAGGSTTDSNGVTSELGGKGAEVGGIFHLTAGEKLEIVVGGVGGYAFEEGSGGGGATFVLGDTGSGDVPLVIAGGGGGAGYANAGGDGQATGTPNGGLGGNAGPFFGGGGGTGFNTSGADSVGSSIAAFGGSKYAGGEAPFDAGAGAFGGGGGGGVDGGGGGGGYSGGQGGQATSTDAMGGGGGFSFDGGIVVDGQTVSGENSGFGSVTLIDATPTAAITSAPGSTVPENATVTITGTASYGLNLPLANGAITLTDNGQTIGTAKTAADGSFTADVALPFVGQNSVVATIVDPNGVSGSSLPVTYFAAAPTATITSALSSTVPENATVTIKGTADYGFSLPLADGAITLTDNGQTIGTAKTAADGSFTADVALPFVGQNNVVATVVDPNGLSGSSSAVTYFAAALTATITSALISTAPENSTVTIAGTANYGPSLPLANGAITLTDNGQTVGTAVTAADGSFTANVALPFVGQNNVVATVVDPNGLSGSSSAVTYLVAASTQTVSTPSDATASASAVTPSPSVAITSTPPASAPDQSTFTITGTADYGSSGPLANGTITLIDNGQAIGRATTAADGSFTADVSLPFVGQNSVVATVIDSNGRSGGSSPANYSLFEGVRDLDPTSQDVERIFYSLLGHPADAADLGTWVAKIERQGSKAEKDLASSLIHSSEYRADNGRHPSAAQFVSALYDAALGHSVDAASLASDVKAFHHGLTQQALAVNIANSAEASAHLGVKPV